MSEQLAKVISAASESPEQSGVPMQPYLQSETLVDCSEFKSEAIAHLFTKSDCLLAYAMRLKYERRWALIFT